jgi:hypothetical protein
MPFSIFRIFIFSKYSLRHNRPLWRHYRPPGILYGALMQSLWSATSTGLARNSWPSSRPCAGRSGALQRRKARFPSVEASSAAYYAQRDSLLCLRKYRKKYVEKGINRFQMGLLNDLIRAKCHSEYSSFLFSDYCFVEKC